MSDGFNEAPTALKTGNLADRLRAKAAVLKAGYTSIDSVIDIMREAAAALDRAPKSEVYIITETPTEGGLWYTCDGLTDQQAQIVFEAGKNDFIQIVGFTVGEGESYLSVERNQMLRAIHLHNRKTGENLEYP